MHTLCPWSYDEQERKTTGVGQMNVLVCECVRAPVNTSLLISREAEAFEHAFLFVYALDSSRLVLPNQDPPVFACMHSVYCHFFLLFI